MTYDPLRGLKREEFRDTVVNWEVEVEEIVDGYHQHVSSLSHAVQKDAIQNSWDARINPDGRGWKCIFELIETKNLTLLSITDEETFGLTGRVLTAHELESASKLPNNERWGRFENMAFKKRQEPGMALELGSRGRGKFVFVGASKDLVIFYDSLRNDGSYRFGLRYVEGTKTQTTALEEDEGRNRLRFKSQNLLKAVNRTGTRIVIVNPIKEVVDDIKSGVFEKYIGATWWYIITKYRAHIALRINGKEQVVTPFPERIPNIDSTANFVWIKESVPVSRHAKGAEMRCKKLHMVYNKQEPVDKEIQGIAIIRAGMKICSHELHNLPPELRNRIHGYILLEDGWENYLREAEGLEHYSLNSNKVPLSLLYQFIKEQSDEFARKKLGLGGNITKVRDQNQKDAEKIALRAVNKLAKKLGMKFGGSKIPDDDDHDGNTKDVRISIARLKLPREDDLRVNYNETVEVTRIRAINQTDSPLNVLITVELQDNEKTVSILLSKEIAMTAKFKETILEGHKIKFEKEHYRPGVYYVSANMVSMMPDSSKGKILDKKRKAVYLEEDPPVKGIFEKCEAMEYPEELKKIMAGYTEGEHRGYIFQYNIRHPEHEDVVDDRDRLTAYLVRLMVGELCKIDLTQPEHKLFEKEHLENPEFLLKRTTDLMGQCLYDFREAQS